MRPYRVVDAFSAVPFRGNPVAVVLQADGLSEAEMQAIAAWTNLSETTFHLTPTDASADYRLRIFTPRNELPFAGHPTIGSAHALIEAGVITPRDGQVVQECAAGLIPVQQAGELLTLRLPEPQFRDLTAPEAAELADLLGAPLAPASAPAVVDVGPLWIVADLGTAAAVTALTPDLPRMATFEVAAGAGGVTVFGRKPEGGIEVRSFVPADGIGEDPVCGSGNGAVAALRLRRGGLGEGDRYLATQGRCVGRDGEIAVHFEGRRIFIGGRAVTTVTGQVAV
ncbi:PhzF family phenazine biosynthesis protein [Ferrimonas balearica]|nr:PhzF family phenazine biosynthesis protein [Ferrimonas balearica]